MICALAWASHVGQSFDGENWNRKRNMNRLEGLMHTDPFSGNASGVWLEAKLE